MLRYAVKGGGSARAIISFDKLERGTTSATSHHVTEYLYKEASDWLFHDIHHRSSRCPSAARLGVLVSERRAQTLEACEFAATYFDHIRERIQRNMGRHTTPGSTGGTQKH